MLYPLKKTTQKEWKQKNLKNIKELEEKNKKKREDIKNIIPNEPYKIPKFKGVPSKLKLEAINLNKNYLIRQTKFPKTPNFGQNRMILNSIPIKQDLSINKDINMINDNELSPIKKNNYEEAEENIYNILNNKTTSMFDKYYENQIKTKIPNNDKIIENEVGIKSKDDKIEKLIREYKEKYGTDEALEKIIKEYYGTDIKSNENKVNKPNQTGYNCSNGVLLPKIQKNYIRENRQLIIDKKVPLKYKSNEEHDTLNDKHKNFGKVPNYIKKYEYERMIQKEEIKRKEEESKYPKGTKLLSEEERLNTLNGLISNKKDINCQLEKMPITTRTNAVRLKKEELYKKLDEIDKAIEMFSKKQVFIKI